MADIRLLFKIIWSFNLINFAIDFTCQYILWVLSLMGSWWGSCGCAINWFMISGVKIVSSLLPKWWVVSIYHLIFIICHCNCKSLYSRPCSYLSTLVTLCRFVFCVRERNGPLYSIPLGLEFRVYIYKWMW